MTECMGSSPTNGPKWACGARTRSGAPCRSVPLTGKKRCRMHGGGSTGPRTPEGRRKVGDAARARYVTEALAEGWIIVPFQVRAAVVALWKAKGGLVNTTAKALGLSRSGVRRILAGLPSRPDEAVQLSGRLLKAPNSSAL